MVNLKNTVSGAPVGDTSSSKYKKGQWGGPWTEQKLDTFEKYVRAYLTIMNNNRDKYNWKIIYFDGFAGSGSRSVDEENNEIQETSNLFGSEVTPEELSVYQGAAERVVGLEKDTKGFDAYYFVETDENSRRSLEAKLSNYQTIGSKHFLEHDANLAVRMLANTLKKHKGLKALVFLDPFGMQIDWESIKLLEGLSVDFDTNWSYCKQAP